MRRFRTRRQFAALAGLLIVVFIGWGIGWGGAWGTRREVQKAARNLAPSAELAGRVLDSDGPVSGAIVRFQGRAESVRTDQQGQFRLTRGASRSPEPHTITAWKDGHYIQGSAGLLELFLRKLPAEDNPAYAWIDPTPNSADSERCGNCHQEIFAEWCDSAHANSVRNRRFMNLYTGTDWQGRPGHGWSLQAEYPGGIGVCASCHAPGLDFEGGASDDLRHIPASATEPDNQAHGADGAQGDAQSPREGRDRTAARGVHCDFCHKIQDLSEGTIGLAHGRFGLKLLRPREGQLFFGPLDDVDRGEETFSPLQSESRYCASCHEGVLFGVHVYGTYTEWLESPARRAGRTCQSCHMTPTGQMTNIAPNAGGIERDPKSLASHSLLPGGRLQMLQRCLKIDTSVARESRDLVHCRVGLVTHDVGHRVPTGFIDRHLLLVVEAFDAHGDSIRVAAGPRLPEAAGRTLAGLPGRLFGRLLVGENGESPAPFWRAANSLPDTRLHPQQPEVTEFQLPGTTAKIRVRLLYRRFWPQVTASKGWPDDTLVVVDSSVEVKSEG